MKTNVNGYCISQIMGKNLAALALAAVLGSGVAIAEPIMYVHDMQRNLGTVDVATGTVTIIGDTNNGTDTLTDIAFSPSGKLFGISFEYLYSINTATAKTTLIGQHSIEDANALVFGTDGTLYGAGANTKSLFTINPFTGESTNIGNMGFASGGDLAFNGGELYLASATSQLIDVDLDDVSASQVVGNFGVPYVYGLATGDNGTLYAVAGTSIYTVNTSTGVATNGVSFAGHGLGNAYGQSFFREAVQQIPEPTTLALLGLGLVGMGFSRRKQ